ncbi:MAG: gamma-glutamyl-gamma-aminobutyrate hydrolase family protein [Candidatus Zixiibacteriota bacterium]
MRPLIGITINEEPEGQRRRFPTPFSFDFVKRQYFELVESSGGSPVLIPGLKDHRLAKELVSQLAGLLLSGGIDLHPKYYRQRKVENVGRVASFRDRLEIELIGEAMKRKLPTFAICRGMQVLNVALGGTLYQDLSLYPSRTLRHHQRGHVDYNLYHRVEVDRGSHLRRILGQSSLKVNSSHHQVVNRLGKDLKAVARAPDGVIEGIESSGDSFTLGVQWHPEAMPRRESTRRLFKAFVAAAERFAKCGKEVAY